MPPAESLTPEGCCGGPGARSGEGLPAVAVYGTTVLRHVVRLHFIPTLGLKCCITDVIFYGVGTRSAVAMTIIHLDVSGHPAPLLMSLTEFAMHVNVFQLKACVYCTAVVQGELEQVVALVPSVLNLQSSP